MIYVKYIEIIFSELYIYLMDITLHHYTAITVSPPYRVGNPQYHYDSDVYELRRWLNRFCNSYFLVPEFSDKGRLHYHGVISVKNWTHLWKSKHQIDRKVGLVCVKKEKGPFKQKLGWTIYCLKNEPPFKPFWKKSLKGKRKVPALEETGGSKSILDYFGASDSQRGKSVSSDPRPHAHRARVLAKATDQYLKATSYD